jgi:hypothetical protein
VPIQPLNLQPGIDVEKTPALNEGSWSAANLIRFREGLPEKRGGWVHINSNKLIGTGRGIHAWADLLGNPYVAVGTEQRLEVLSGGLFTDITPLRKTSNITPNFTTVTGSPIITVTDTANGAATSDWVNITVPVSVGGQIIQGFYQVQTVIDANNYTITIAPKVAITTITNGGSVPAFTTTMGSPNISVLLGNHGLLAGAPFQVQVATTVGGITLAAGSSYTIVSVTSSSRFVIAPGPNAASAQTVSENGGNAQIEYLVPTGFVSNTPAAGYGIGIYGEGLYGVSSASTTTNFLRQWFLDNWGQDLIGNYTGSPIFVWVPPIAFGNVALAINTTNFPGAADPPLAVNESFVSIPQQQMIALGCSPVGGGTQDPNLVRFSDVADFTDWTPTATNQAGSFRIPTGSRLVGGTSNGTYCVLWTDIDLWLMAYLGFPLVWGFNKVASGCGLLAGRAFGNYKSNIYWVTRDQFMVFDGSTAQILDCPVWDFFFYNLDTTQNDKVFCAVNSEFGEIEWYFPSLTGGGECDSYVTYSAFESQRAGFPVWHFGKLARTCWTDVNVYGPPLATDTSGNLQQHEVGYDNDGIAMLPSITSGYITISEGTFFTTVKRIIPDMVLNGGTAPNNAVFFTLNLLNYPTDTPQVVGPFQWTPSSPEFIMTMCRGRLMSITIQSVALGVFWRLGAFRIDGAPSGRR